MSYFSDLDLQIEEVRNAMADHTIDPVGIALREAFGALDDLLVLANSTTTREQVKAEKILIGQLLTRCQLLASFALDEKFGLRILTGGRA